MKLFQFYSEILSNMLLNLKNTSVDVNSRLLFNFEKAKASILIEEFAFGLFNFF